MQYFIASSEFNEIKTSLASCPLKETLLFKLLSTSSAFSLLLLALAALFNLQKILMANRGQGWRTKQGVVWWRNLCEGRGQAETMRCPEIYQIRHILLSYYKGCPLLTVHNINLILGNAPPPCCLCGTAVWYCNSVVVCRASWAVCREITERATKIHFNKHMQSFMAKRGATRQAKQPVVASWLRRLITEKPCASGFKLSWYFVIQGWSRGPGTKTASVQPVMWHY